MRYSKYITTFSAIGDFLIFNLLFIFSFCYLKHFEYGCIHRNALLFYIYINLSWGVTLSIFQPYSIERETSKKEIFYVYLKSVIFFLPLFLLFFQIISFNYYPRSQVKYLFPIFLIVLLTWRYSVYFVFILYRRAGYNFRNVIIVGNNETGNELKEYFIKNPWAGYHFKGFFTFNNSNKKDVKGTYQDIEAFIINNKIDEIYLVSSDLSDDVYKIINKVIGKHSVKIRFVPALGHFSFMSVKLIKLDSIHVLKIQESPLMFWYNRLIKRLFDFLFSFLIILIILSWLIPLVALINIITGNKGNIFFIQLRTGVNNKPFKLIKFRSMYKNAESDTKQVTKNDIRITTFGKFLRKTSIDEIPQFINVFKGQMSVVGPRPHMLNHTDEYKNMVKKFMIRHSIKPGITGYSQVRGLRGEIKRIRDLKNRIKYDLYYVENWTFNLDMKIILLTILKLLKGDTSAY